MQTIGIEIWTQIWLTLMFFLLPSWEREKYRNKSQRRTLNFGECLWFAKRGNSREIWRSLSYGRRRGKMPGHGKEKRRYFQRKDGPIQILQRAVQEKDWQRPRNRRVTWDLFSRVRISTRVCCPQTSSITSLTSVEQVKIKIAFREYLIFQQPAECTLLLL